MATKREEETREEGEISEDDTTTNPVFDSASETASDSATEIAIDSASDSASETVMETATETTTETATMPITPMRVPQYHEEVLSTPFDRIIGDRTKRREPPKISKRKAPRPLTFGATRARRRLNLDVNNH